VTVNQLVKEVGRVMGVDAKVRYLPARHEVVHAYAVHQKVREAFDLSLDYVSPLAAGLDRMWLGAGTWGT
jgi:hypothetical protein